MTHSYLAFIDESGDDGTQNFRKIGGGGGASRWFIITACIYRASRDSDAVGWRDEIKSTCGKKNQDRAIHFAEFDHNQKRAACQLLPRRPIRFISAITRKDVTAAEVFTEKNRLYFYLTRYVIERLSWFARDMRQEVREGDGRVQITFSRRGGMSYPGFKEYLDRLKTKKSEEVAIHWPVIDIEGIRAESHSARAGLQLADCGARAVAEAVEPDRFGNVEGAYLKLLKPALYHSRDGNYLSYGLKFLPNIEGAQLDAKQKEAFNDFIKPCR